ncbi:DUF736 family protein [Nitrospirillum amazonense]|nr:DUF736 family protein [Nitrospirillum amazonense]
MSNRSGKGSPASPPAGQRRKRQKRGDPLTLTVYAGNGQRYEVGAGWSQVAKSSGETYVNLKIGAPEFGPSWVRARLVKLEQPVADGPTHMALWEPRDR